MYLFAYSNNSVFEGYQCERKAETNWFCSVFIQIRSSVNITGLRSFENSVGIFVSFVFCACMQSDESTQNTELGDITIEKKEKAIKSLAVGLS